MSGAGDATWNGTYISQGFYGGAPYWRETPSDHYLWWYAPFDQWFLNEYPGSYEDTDNFAYQKSTAGDEPGDYWWWEISATGTPSPDCSGVYEYESRHEGKTTYLGGPAQAYEVFWCESLGHFLIAETGVYDHQPTDPWWQCDHASLPWGTYSPQGSASGTVTMSGAAKGVANVVHVVP